jgi:hypothetical protein
MIEGTLSDIVSILVLDSDEDLLKNEHADFETRIDWIHYTTEKKTHEIISQLWKVQLSNLFDQQRITRPKPTHLLSIVHHWADARRS